MNSFIRGQKGKLSDQGLSDSFVVKLDMSAPGFGVDISCFGLDAQGQLSDERYMVFYNQTSAPNHAIFYAQEGQQTRFQTELAQLPGNIEKLVFTASSDNGSMRSLGPCQMLIGDAIAFPFSGADFQDEKAIIIGELYRRDGQWRFGAVGQGFNGGLSALLKHFGGVEADGAQSGPTSGQPPLSGTLAGQVTSPISSAAPSGTPSKISLSKVTLEKRGDKVSLEKRDGAANFGKIRVNLNWNQRVQAVATPQKSGLFGSLFGKREQVQSSNIDLDLGCLYELKNGRIGIVQALGNAFGNYEAAPFIALDGDDRSGASKDGENLSINGAFFDQIKRVLIFTFIYDGVANWAATDGVVTLQAPGQPPVEVRLDNGTDHDMCAIAMLENINGNLQLTKLVDYFAGDEKISGHQKMDEKYRFGLKWVTGSKD